MEFISLEHTPKNILIKAVRNGRPDRQKYQEYLAFAKDWQIRPTSRKNWCASGGFRNDRTDFYMEAHWDCFQGAFYCNKNPPARKMAGGFCTFSEFYLSS